MRKKSLLLKAAGAIVGLSALATSSGCATTMTQTEIKMLETRELDLPYEEAYNAALNGMFSMGLQVQHSDKASGIISGQAGDYIRQAQAGYWRGLFPVRKVTLLVTEKGPNLSQLRMKVLINEVPKVDQQLMTKIWQQIEREAMLESRPSDRHPST